MIQPNTVITGDSLTVLRSMDDESVDMVITDPPYGIDYQSGRKEKERRLAKIKNDKAPFIWWIYDAARVVKRGGGYGLERQPGESDLELKKRIAFLKQAERRAGRR